MQHHHGAVVEPGDQGEQGLAHRVRAGRWRRGGLVGHGGLLQARGVGLVQGYPLPSWRVTSAVPG
jgi:hypothetical protein